MSSKMLITEQCCSIIWYKSYHAAYYGHTPSPSSPYIESFEEVCGYTGSVRPALPAALVMYGPITGMLPRKPTMTPKKSPNRFKIP